MNTYNKTINFIVCNFRQIIKYTVYSLLFVNYFFYMAEEWGIAQHTLKNSESFLDWTAAFKTVIDVTAWLMFLILFELETYILADDEFTKFRVRLMHVARFICYAFVLHTLYTNGMAAYDLINDNPVAINSLCELVGKDISYTYNYAYTLIDSNNCHSLSSGSSFYSMDNGAVVADQRGWDFEQYMSKMDFMETTSWLAIVLTIEFIVRLQERGTASGYAIKMLNKVKFLFYGYLWVAIAHWLYYGHYLYAWDEFLWIAGFFAIEMNVAEWRQEMVDEGVSHHSLT